MGSFDLSSADMALVSGQEVDLLRIANVDVWTKPANVMESVFGELAPAGSFNDDNGSGLTFGTRVRFLTSGNIVGVKWYCPSTAPSNTVPWFVVKYDPSSDDAAGPLVNGVFGSLTPNQWNSVLFDAVPVSAGDEVVVDAWTADWYVATTHFFDSDVVSSGGHLVGPADDEFSTPSHRNGRFWVGNVVTWPQNGFHANAYFIDVLFTPS